MDIDFVDKSYRGIIAERLSPFKYIKRSDYDKRNKNKSWEYRKYTDIDPNFMCISKDGTLGEIWRVGDLILGLPSNSIDGVIRETNASGKKTERALKKDIINVNIDSNGKRLKEPLADEDCIWRRTPIPNDFIKLEIDYKRQMRKTKGLKRNDIKRKYVQDKERLEEKYSRFIDKEFQRRKYGLFVKIDEEIIYITGENYMFLNYYFLAEDKVYPNFRMTATHTWWHWEGCVVDKDCWGELRLKSRRVAWTVEACSIALNGFTLNRYAAIPIVSENDRLAKKLFTKKIVDPFQYYPSYFIPLIDDPNDKAKSELEITFNTDHQETSAISYYPTKDVAYDSTKASPISINDEVGKYTNVEFTEFRGNHKDCHFRGLTKIVSTGKFGSTAGSFSNGGESYQYEFENASALKRDRLGKTKTGLISLFVDCCFTEGGFFDKWGYPIVYDPVEPILNEDGEYIDYGAITAWNIEEQKLKKGKKSDHNNFLRQHPRSVEHAFRSEGGINNDFDIDNMNNHSDFLGHMTEHQIAETIFRGNLAWKGEPFESDVEWRPNTNGKIYTTWIPDKELQNKASLRNHHGKKLMMPDNNHIGCLGVDSYDLDGQAADGKGSDGSVIGYSKFSMTGAPSHSFFLKYAERPDKRDDFYEDVIKMCKFFGMFALIESNKPRLLEYFYDKGFRGYSMDRPDKKWKDLSDAEKKYGGIPSSKQTNNDQASLLKDYIFDYIGQNLENDCKLYFKDIVDEWIKFNVKKRKDFDKTVSCQLALLGSQYRVKQRKTLYTETKSGISIRTFSA